MHRLLALTLVALVAPATVREPIDYAVNARIREEARNNSQIMRTLHHLTDIYGPRLTGSPNHENAANWAARQMTEWGLENARLEPWEFGHPGWMNERFSGHIVSPVKDSLVGEVLAWTPSTSGTVTADAVHLLPPQEPTELELATWLASVRPTIKGRIVLVGGHTVVPVTIQKTPLRRDHDELRRQYDANAPEVHGPPPGVLPRPTPQGRLTTTVVNERIDAMLVSGGALVRVNDAGRDHGQIRAFHNRTFDVTRAVPTVILRNEDYGRITRILGSGLPVRLEFTIVNRLYPEGRTSYNVLADIPGTDKADEVVMLGGHLDSWHAATGATDNAIGCAVMMEAARIIQALGLRPRRTIRVALWSGEEQGLLGSKAYVADHFGTFERPKPAFHTFGGYLNIDSGTGRVRGASIFGPPAAADVLRAILEPFEDLGVAGVANTTSRRAGGSDHTSFNAAGLPGVRMTQDPIEYITYTWHTNLDTYERIIEDDAKKSAISIASAVYHLAKRDELLPRFSPEEMPPPAGLPAGRTTTAAQQQE